MKIIAFYLPQFHPFKENDEWWGKGFTEWTNVSTAKPTFKGQYMPRVPYKKNYYSLLDVDTLKWQAEIAKEYGIYGFAYYHYWFEEGMLMQKPAELMLKNKDIDIPFCFSWANHTWKRSWANKSDEILRKQTYGDEKEWKKHFDYLLPFFKDSRYIKIDDKPVMILYNPLGVKEFPDMIQLWQIWAKKNGLNGITFLHQQNNFDHTKENRGDLYSGGIEFQMNRAINEVYNNRNLGFQLERVLNRVANVLPFLRCKATTIHYDYDKIWNHIINSEPKGETWYPGAFVDFDNTPRRKNRGQVFINMTPEKYYKYLKEQIIHAREVYKKDYLFMFAWNEWGESGYLEPDEKRGYQILEYTKKALEETNEFPDWRKFDEN